MTGLLIVLRDPLYRAFFLVLLYQGVAGGATFPLISLWATQSLGADAVGAGLLRTAAGVAGVAFGLLLGVSSDRTLRRRPWIVAGLSVGVVGRVGMAATEEYGLGVALYALSGLASYTLMFGQLGDWLRHRAEPHALAVNNAVRLAFALGWLVGPIAGSALVEAAGYGPLFLAAAAVQALSLFFAARDLRDAPVRPAEPAGEEAPPAGLAGLVLYTAAMLCITTAEPSRFVILPLYVTEVLGERVTGVGLLFTLGALFELPLFLLVGRLADRVGVVPLLFVGLAAEVLYFGGLALSGALWQLAALEPLFAFAIATSNGIGILYVQNLQPRRAGTALGLYNAAYQLGPVVSAPLLGYMAVRHGWSSPFLLSAGLSAASLGFFWASTRTGRLAAGRRRA